jgi:hypothetical protein
MEKGYPAEPCGAKMTFLPVPCEALMDSSINQFEDDPKKKKRIFKLCLFF